MVAKFYGQNYIFYAHVYSTFISACNALQKLDQDCVGYMSPQFFFVITYLIEDEQELSLGMLDML
jgi:hypothetical protein